MARTKTPPELVLAEGKQWFSSGEVAKALGKHKMTLVRWEKDGLIDPPRRAPLGLAGKVFERQYSREQVQAMWDKLTGASKTLVS